MYFLGGTLHESEVRHSAFQDLNGRVYLLCNGLQHDHIGEQCSELTIEFHVVVPDDVQHTDQKLHSLNVKDALALKYTEEVAKLVLVGAETAVQDLLALEVGETVDHVRAFFAVALHDGFYEVYKV